jgi:carbohydrate diacid regulator
MDKIDAKMIVAFARCNMKIKVAANTIFYNKNSLTYHFNRVRRETGLNPRNFFDLVELYEIARGILTDDEIESI